MDLNKAKAAIDTDAARSFAGRSDIELDGLLAFLRQSVVDEEWKIARAKNAISAYQAVIDKIEEAKNPARAEIHKHD